MVLPPELLQEVERLVNDLGAEAALAHVRSRPRRTIRTEERAALLAEFEGRCAYCDGILSGKRWHIDHVIPLSAGGSDKRDNLVPACARCNLLKRQRLGWKCYICELWAWDEIIHREVFCSRRAILNRKRYAVEQYPL